MEPFFFQPPKPIASVREGTIKAYSCCICGEERPASEMLYQGGFMEVIRDKTKFCCKRHLNPEYEKAHPLKDFNF